MSFRKLRACLPSILLGLMAVAFATAAHAQAVRTGPSAFCHVTDGAFTDCMPGLEWSDIDSLRGLGASSGAIVYTDQRVSPSPALMLMYDLVDHHFPLASDESFDVQFDVVEDGKLEHYLAQCFGNGSLEPVKVFVDGVPLAPPFEGIKCAVGGGPTPTSFFDVFVELEVPMNVVYSPDIPLFWSSSAPRPCDFPDPFFCHFGAPLQPAARVPTSSTLVNAGSDGTTTVAVVPLGPTAADLCVRGPANGALEQFIDMLVPPPPVGVYRNHGQYVRQVTHATDMALDSMVNSGVLTPAEAGMVHGCVVSERAKNK